MLIVLQFKDMITYPSRTIWVGTGLEWSFSAKWWARQTLPSQHPSQQLSFLYRLLKSPATTHSQMWTQRIIQTPEKDTGLYTQQFLPLFGCEKIMPAQVHNINCFKLKRVLFGHKSGFHFPKHLILQGWGDNDWWSAFGYCISVES